MRTFRRLLAVLIVFALIGGAGTSPTATAQGTVSPRSAQQIDADTVDAGRFDDGRMWTFDAPPLDYFERQYDFRPGQDWMEKARLGTLRIPGCTASFVSPNGLVLTNHHCARSHATKVGRSGEEILRDGFYAESLGEERRVPGLYADQLVDITDVTSTVQRALANAETDAERMQARSEVTDSLQTAFVEEAGGEGFRAEVVTLYDGAQYKVYTYRRYQDVRLALIPELRLGYFGGDTDNFTYPRYALDMAFFRIYGADGDPLEPEHHFEWDPQGSRPGDAAFVVGNPGSTLRLETYDQLRFRRDVQDANLLATLRGRVEALEAYVEASEDPSETWQNRIFSLKNGMKLYEGRVNALNDAYTMTRIEQGDEQFRRAIREDSTLRAQYGGVLDSMAAIQEEKRSVAPAYQAFRLMQSPYASATLRRALTVATAGAAQGEQRDRALAQLRSIGTQPAGVDERFVADRLGMFRQYFGAESDAAEGALAGRSPAARAEQVISESVLADSAGAVRAYETGSIPEDDPALQVIGAVADRYRTYRSAWSGLMARQDAVAAELGRARFALYGTDVPPDATSSLRLSDGVVQGYAYNGTRAPAYTTFYGMYSHHHAFGDGSEWDLPERWESPPSSFDRSTPVNLVSTNDITGGNSGSPLLSKDLKLIGLIFDGNIESLAGDFIFMPEQMRAVSVDVRGMLEALEEIYDADRLAQEVTGGAFVETEAAATDAR
jgi:hypothetical protein